ncbi:uncharacterized protein K452DRAFT_35515 [Aplosporella prunicola CBS 121167]|uniref:Uncharacterized protein n=1 Tax=Aplosporella prunicola CBS 121167 TaxID=1176127 RepID=A0A6A6AVN3_9PEZI|nr:uncharacterized protein K452DRAFT_35515 [Aplosporella prunicola CBS 121167]KAF2135288.1 hypothetical protein K452DRAFT_35515 [Aplosporella prunicola CBS 121167]
MTDASFEKPTLSRETLEQQNIFFDEDFYQDADEEEDVGDGRISYYDLPQHVNTVRQALLNFEGRIPDCWSPHFDHDSLPADYFQPPTPAIEKPDVEGITFETCKDLMKQVEEKRTAWSEADWVHFLRSRLFKSYEDAYPNRTKFNNLFDRWSSGQNICWEELRERPHFDPYLTFPTAPKPDLTFGFPVIDSSDRLPNGFAQETSVQNFSEKILSDLIGAGVIPTVTTGLRIKCNRGSRKMFDADNLCFPWAVFESKRSGLGSSGRERCYCQAANASSAALTLLEGLFRKTYGQLPNDLGPIIAFTNTGAAFRVWLTFQTKYGKHMMVCIWESSLDCIWGILSTSIIIANMHIWASRVLKSRISACISEFRRKRHVG